MYQLVIKIALRYPEGAHPSSVDQATIGVDLVQECIYDDMGLHGLPHVCTALANNGDPDQRLLLTVQVNFGITGCSEKELPPLEIVSKMLYSYLAIKFFGVIQQVDYVRVQLQQTQGLWTVYCLEPDPTNEAYSIHSVASETMLLATAQ